MTAGSLPELRCGSGRARRVRSWLVQAHPGRGTVCGGTQEQRIPGGPRNPGGQRIPGGKRSPGEQRSPGPLRQGVQARQTHKPRLH